MNDFLNNNNVTNKLKKILKDKIEPNCTILEISNARIYIAYEDSEFEYTNIEGYLCLVINRKFSCLFLHLYEYVGYKKEFEIELYTNIEKGYSVLKDNFHCIEFPTFFLGINFSHKISSEKMKNIILFNSIVLNSQLDLFNFSNSKKNESNYKRNINLVNEINNFSLNEEFEKPDKLVQFYMNKEENNVVIEIKKNEFESSFNSLGIFISNIEGHYKKALKGVVGKSDEMINYHSTNIDKKFVEFNMSKRKSILSFSPDLVSEFKKTKNSSLNAEEKRSSIKHFLHLQVDIIKI
jgi:hypothetical protein